VLWPADAAHIFYDSAELFAKNYLLILGSRKLAQVKYSARMNTAESGENNVYFPE
jgi:hypothetical protein